MHKKFYIFSYRSASAKSHRTKHLS